MDVSATGFGAGSISRQSEKRFPETAKSKKNGGRRINAGLSRLIMKKLTDLEYLRLNTFQRLWYNIVLFVLGIPGWLASLVKAVGNGIAGPFRSIRNELTDEWRRRGVQKGREYTILTDEITRAWSGMNTRQYKNLKGLKKENLRDNMSDLELVLTMLAEASTTDIAKAEQPQGFDENQQVARRGGNVAGVARKALEAETGKPVVTAQNAESFRQLVTDIVTDAAQLPEQMEENENGK